ncbi:efflux RND transporter periplasmic adaptor subunit [Rhizobium sp. X9]|uniref:efflux RND transporter periplasmic adaptor subunit n=1 Tax=Rhizobium sp. X9 TaxID=2815360 RepID=UPI001C0C73E3|nr:efflux RND transporter periplasmic adaptor subunit [Rhizobium sp. X9]
MSNKAATLFLAGAVIAGGTLATVYRDEIGPYAKSVLALASSTAASEAVAQPAQMPVPQVPVAEVITRKVAPSVEFTGHLEAAKAQLQQANVLHDQAEIDFGRTEALTSKGNAPRKAFDDAQAMRRQRQAQVDIAKVAVSAAELDLSFTRVTAPIAGRVDRVLITEGNLVTGGNAGAATLLTTIVATDPLYVYFDIDEATYLGFVANARAPETGTVAGKLPVHLGLMTDTGFPHTGELDFLGNRVDRSTGTIRARAIVKNPDGRLTPGLFARVKLVTAEPAQTVLIDDQAIGIDQGRRYVLALGADNKAEYRPVEIGPMIDGLRVVAAGLKPADKIIVKGLVRPGMQVVPQMISMLPGDAENGDQAAAGSQEARQ